MFLIQDVLIGKVHCDDEEALCHRFSVTGTPTLLYGDPLNLKEYAGDKDYPSLNAWAKEVLIPICSPDNLTPCTELEKKRIKEWMAMDVDTIETEIGKKTMKEENAHKKFETEMAILQSRYDDLNNEFSMEKAKIITNLKLLKSIRTL